jgi:hypothetical protein
MNVEDALTRYARTHEEQSEERPAVDVLEEGTERQQEDHVANEVPPPPVDDDRGQLRVPDAACRHPAPTQLRVLQQHRKERVFFALQLGLLPRKHGLVERLRDERQRLSTPGTFLAQVAPVRGNDWVASQVRALRGVGPSCIGCLPGPVAPVGARRHQQLQLEARHAEPDNPIRHPGLAPDHALFGSERDGAAGIGVGQRVEAPI